MIAIVDYKAGNLTSVKLALDALGADAKVTSNPETIRQAERIIFPGVGAAGSAMSNLNNMRLIDPLKAFAKSGKPFLGICLGMQILFEHSEEDGGVDLLGLLPGKICRFADTQDCKIPQIGWNQVKQSPHPLFAGIEDGSEFYFVHSYRASVNPNTIGMTEYAGENFTAAVASGNVAATQFHPEKSGRIGLDLLRNFLNWNP